MKMIIVVNDGDRVTINGEEFQINGLGAGKSFNERDKPYHTSPELRLTNENDDDVTIVFPDCRAIFPSDLKALSSLVED